MANLKKERAALDEKIKKLEGKVVDTGRQVTAVSVLEVQPAPFYAFVEVLAALDAAAVEQQVKAQEVQLGFAKTVYEKQQRLWKQDIGSEIQLLQAKSTYETAQKQLEATIAQRNMYRIISPISGTVDQVNIKIGDAAAPGGGGGLQGIRVVSTDKLKAEASLGESYLGKVKVGDPVTLLFPDINDSIKTKVTYVAQAVDPVSRAFNVQIRLGNNSKLHPNMSCKMKINNYTNGNVITVPVSVIQNLSQGDVVYVANGNKAKAVIVKAGRNSNGMVEILSGLSAGDRVITEGYEDLDDGEDIQVARLIMKDNLNKSFFLSNWAINNRTAVYIITVIITLAGLMTYNSLPKEQFPEVKIPQIIVQTLYPGTSPENMENLVTKPIEKEVKNLTGVKKVTSNSFQDYSVVIVEFNTNVKVDKAKRDTKDAVDKARPDLPKNLPNEPEVNDVDISELPILYVNISGNYDLAKLKKYAEDVEDRIEEMKEIKRVDIVGALDREIQINMDLYKMQAAGITFDDVERTIASENISATAGEVAQNNKKRIISVRNEFKSAAQIGNTIIKNGQGKSVYLQDIADVRDSFEEQESYARMNGVEELRSDFQANKPEIVFDLDRERMNNENITTGTVVGNLRTAVFGKEISRFRDEKDDYPITLRILKEQRENIDAVRNMPIIYRDMGMGGVIRQVPVSAFANVYYDNTYGGIKRKDQIRIITLSSNLLTDYDVNKVVADIQSEINNFKLPAGVTARMGGQQEDQEETMNFLSTAGLTAVALIFLILILQFNSFSRTVIIMFEIILSIFGVLLGLGIFRTLFSMVFSGIGIIALMGIVVRNGILLVEFMDQLLKEGIKPYDAIIEAGRTRMTPVLLTATAAILGLIPLAVGLNIDFATLFKDGAMGIHNTLPWHLPADLRFFKQTTLGKPVVMGSRTWESLGRKLPGRLNIVLSSRKPDLPEDVLLFSNLKDALKRVRAEDTDEAFVIGGSKVFAEAMPELDRMYITRVQTVVAGADTFFPEEAELAGVDEVNAMTIATVDAAGTPHARIVLLKGLDDQGFSFFTNYQSAKGQQLAANAKVAVVFFWRELERQVRIEGTVRMLTPAENDAYFNSRPEGSKIGAWASPQSREIPARQGLEDLVNKYTEAFKDKEIPRPENWGGYCIKPDYIEFWQGRSSRLHDRIVFEKGVENIWRRYRIAP
ncbi:pyridoxamine 5'-phosphate oxidase [Ostertagia ostertagi]